MQTLSQVPRSIRCSFGCKSPNNGKKPGQTRWESALADSAATDCARAASGQRAAECGQQFPPSDGDCHTPLPCEVRKWNDTTPRACGLHIQGGQDTGCFTRTRIGLFLPATQEPLTITPPFKREAVP